MIAADAPEREGIGPKRLPSQLTSRRSSGSLAGDESECEDSDVLLSSPASDVIEDDDPVPGQAADASAQDEDGAAALEPRGSGRSDALSGDVSDFPQLRSKDALNELCDRLGIEQGLRNKNAGRSHRRAIQNRLKIATSLSVSESASAVSLSL